MYAWFFRTVLPGPLWLRLMISLVLVAAVILGLMEFVFPWLSEHSPLGDVTLEDG